MPSLWACILFLLSVGYGRGRGLSWEEMHSPWDETLCRDPHELNIGSNESEGEGDTIAIGCYAGAFSRTLACSFPALAPFEVYLISSTHRNRKCLVVFFFFFLFSRVAPGNSVLSVLCVGGGPTVLDILSLWGLQPKGSSSKRTERASTQRKEEKGRSRLRIFGFPYPKEKETPHDD